jgi:hypothetical protein
MSPMPKKKHLEGDTKAEVKKVLDEFGYFWWMPPANSFGKSGASDFHAIKAGVFLTIETKLDAKLTENQRAFCNSIRAEDGFGFVVRGNDGVMWLRRFLESFQNATKATANKLTPTAEDGADMLNAIAALTVEL